MRELAEADEVNASLAIRPGGGSGFFEKYNEAFRKFGISGFYERRYPGTPTDPNTFYQYAIKHAVSGEKDKAFDYLERSTDARMFLAAFVKANPLFEELRGEERYKNILRKMQLDRPAS